MPKMTNEQEAPKWFKVKNYVGYTTTGSISVRHFSLKNKLRFLFGREIQNLEIRIEAKDMEFTEKESGD